MRQLFEAPSKGGIPMKFVFDLDGTLCFDRRTIDDEIMQVLLNAPKYGHELAFAISRSYRDCLLTLGPELSQKMVVALNGGLVYQDKMGS